MTTGGNELVHQPCRRWRKRNHEYQGEPDFEGYRRFQDDEAGIRDWLNSRNAPLLHVAYEDLVRDPRAIVSKAAAFIRDEAPASVDLAHQRYFPMSDDVNLAFAERFRGELDETGEP